MIFISIVFTNIVFTYPMHVWVASSSHVGLTHYFVIDAVNKYKASYTEYGNLKPALPLYSKGH